MEDALIGATTAVIAALLTWMAARQQLHHERIAHQQTLESARASLERELEYRSRERLRSTYSSMLAAQRRYREASRKLGIAGGAEHDRGLADNAMEVRAEFMEQYHAMNLDASPEMWHDARVLRRTLSSLHEAAYVGDMHSVNQLVEAAGHARVNLEGSFRALLGHDPLQSRKVLDLPTKPSGSKRIFLEP